jgi:monofunctional biosynthetic peptidoglycan transglycosylase
MMGLMSGGGASTPPETFSDWRRLTPDEMRRRRFLRLGIVLVALGLVLWFIPPVWQLLDGPITVTRWQRVKGETQAVVGPGQKGWTSSKRISRHALYAIVAAEDGRFYQHIGIDPAEMWASLQTNIKRGKFARGGSTITQQVVKMAFLGREKTIVRKMREATGALILELILPKDKILEWYINLAEFGDGVYSVADGAWHYFKTKPELLTIEQSVHLALVLPSPNGWSGGLRRGRLTAFGNRRFAAILNRMRQSGYITKVQWLTAVTRGDFGRPIAGYTQLVQAEQHNEMLCPGNPGCPEQETDQDNPLDDDNAELSFPRTANRPIVSPLEEILPSSPAAAGGVGDQSVEGSPTPPEAAGDDGSAPEAAGDDGSAPEAAGDDGSAPEAAGDGGSAPAPEPVPDSP